ncbi:MAG: thioredoxin family protein [Pirellulales bacterium]
MAIVAATLLTALLAGTSGLHAAEEGWLVDFAAAKEQAAKEGKDILMEFTGSDWCPPCIALKKNVLDTEVFKTKAPEKFILLKLDSPRDKSKQSPAEIAQYRKLADEFKVQGVPTIILVDAQGRPYAKTVGFGGQKAEDYVETLVKNQESRTKRDEALAKAEKAEGAEKAKLLDEALAVVDAEMAIAQYRDIVDQIVALDADNAGGLKAKYGSLLSASEVRSALQAIVRGFATDGVEASVKKIDELLEAKKPTGALLQEVLVMKGQMYLQTDKAKAKEVLEAAQKADPEGQLARQIGAFLKSQFPAEEKSGDEKKSDEKKSDAADAKKEGDK